MLSTDNSFHDVASAISIGNRERQEDALAANFSVGTEFGFAVLADGMGGHAAGDRASGITVTEVFSELKMLSEDPALVEQDIQQILLEAVAGANQCIALYAQQNPEAHGLGSTVIVPVCFGDRLYWISIGDSPLFLFRDGNLVQLNEDHSMSQRIDQMCRDGVISFDEAKSHPDRNCLMSVLSGQKISRIDCPKNHIKLQQGDIVVAASDGLQFLSDEQIRCTLDSVANQSSAKISAKLLREVDKLGHPDQDNVSLCIIKLDQLPSEWANEASLHANLEARQHPSAENVQHIFSKKAERTHIVRALVKVSRKASQV